MSRSSDSVLSLADDEAVRRRGVRRRLFRYNERRRKRRRSTGIATAGRRPCRKRRCHPHWLRGRRIGPSMSLVSETIEGRATPRRPFATAIPLRRASTKSAVATCLGKRRWDRPAGTPASLIILVAEVPVLTDERPPARPGRPPRLPRAARKDEGSRLGAKRKFRGPRILPDVAANRRANGGIVDRSAAG